MPNHPFDDKGFWLNTRVQLEVDVLTLLALHGNICLALRHPQNIGGSRNIMVDFVGIIGRRLVEMGAITDGPRRLAEGSFYRP